MPLNSAQLATDLTAILSGATASPSAAAAGDNWGASYDAYAKTGAANAVPPVVPAPTTAALKSALGSAFLTLPGVPATVAAAIASALDAYWVATTFAGAVGPPVPGGGAALMAALSASFASVGGTHAGKAGEIRDALHAYTQAVLVTFPGPATFPVL